MFPEKKKLHNVEIIQKKKVREKDSFESPNFPHRQHRSAYILLTGDQNFQDQKGCQAIKQNLHSMSPEKIKEIQTKCHKIKVKFTFAIFYFSLQGQLFQQRQTFRRMSLLSSLHRIKIVFSFSSKKVFSQFSFPLLQVSSSLPNAKWK